VSSSENFSNENSSRKEYSDSEGEYSQDFEREEFMKKHEDLLRAPKQG